MLPLAASIKVVIHIELEMCALFNKGFFGSWVLDIFGHDWHYKSLIAKIAWVSLPNNRFSMPKNWVAYNYIVNWLLMAPAIWGVLILLFLNFVSFAWNYKWVELF